MKIINILTTLCFLFIAAACSMEEDILNGVDPSTSVETESYAVFNISLLTGSDNPSTKVTGDTETPTGSESTVSNCLIAVIDEGGNVVASYYADNYPKGGTGQNLGEILNKKITKHITIKVPDDEDNIPNFTFVAFAQFDVYRDDAARLQQCTTLAQLKKVVLTTHPNTAIKTGSITVNELKAKAAQDGQEWKLKLSPQNTDHTQCNNITIPVKLRSARIQLDEFKVAGVSDDLVEVTCLQILKTCQLTYMDSEYTNASYNGINRIESTYEYVPGGLISGYPEDSTNPDHYYKTYDKARFYVYENTSTTDKTSLRIKYKVNGGSEEERIYTIKTPVNGVKEERVLAGHLYKLYVTVSYAASDDVQFVVSDWEGNTLNVGDIFPNN